MPSISETRSQDDAEHARLEAIARVSRYGEGPNEAMVRYSARVFSRFFRGSRCLEMGPAEGHMTSALAAAFPSLSIVEGSPTFCEDLKARFPEADVTCALFEEYAPTARFDTVVLGHVLEHVVDPVGLLGRVKGWLAPGAVVLAAVPNARSLHRQAAVLMGMLETEDAMNEADIHHGHRRVYGPEAFRNDFLRAGYTLEHFGGFWLKPVSNGQIQRDWSPEMIEAFMQLGERYPDVAACLTVAARVGEGGQP